MPRRSPPSPGARWTPIAALVAAAGWIAASSGCAASSSASSSAAQDPRASLTVERMSEAIGRLQPGAVLIPPTWPGEARVAVAVTVEVDGELASIRDVENATPGELLDGRFGLRAGLARILDLLRSFDVPATFFVPAVVATTYPQAIVMISKTGRHEVGLHGWAHEANERLDRGTERALLEKSIETFEELGMKPRVYRSPSGDFSPSTLLLLEELGIPFDSSLGGDDQPYLIFAGIRPASVIEFPVSPLLDDATWFSCDPAPCAAPRDVFSIWRDEFEGTRAERGLVLLTLHSGVSGHWSRLRVLEELFEHMRSRGDVWFATLSQAGEHLTTPPPRSREAPAAPDS